MMRFRSLVLLPALWLAAPAAPAAAQAAGAGVPLDGFIHQVARLWAAGDVGGIVEMLPSDGSLLLDTGSGTEAVSGRHAAAALRDLFDHRQTTAARAVQVTVAGTEPSRGFGELTWTFRDRGAPGEQTRVVYVATIQQDQGWRIAELRLMP